MYIKWNNKSNKRVKIILIQTKYIKVPKFIKKIKNKTTFMLKKKKKQGLN